MPLICKRTHTQHTHTQTHTHTYTYTYHDSHAPHFLQALSLAEAVITPGCVTQRMCRRTHTHTHTHTHTDTQTHTDTHMHAHILALNCRHSKQYCGGRCGAFKARSNSNSHSHQTSQDVTSSVNLLKTCGVCWPPACLTLRMTSPAGIMENVRKGLEKWHRGCGFMSIEMSMRAHGLA